VKTSGIYKILNKINGKYYVGSAKNIYDRWSDHKKDLKKSRHHNRHLQRAWDKYGKENFELVVVETCVPEALLDREQEHLTRCKSVPDTNDLRGGWWRGLRPRNHREDAKKSCRFSWRKEPPLRHSSFRRDQAKNKSKGDSEAIRPF
jgi:group I intron endonuclease